MNNIKKFKELFESINNEQLFDDVIEDLLDSKSTSLLLYFLKNKIIDVNFEINGYPIITYIYSFSDEEPSFKYGYELLQYLLENGADINTIDNVGDTVLINAFYIDNSIKDDDRSFKFFKLVLKFNPDLSIKNKNNEDIFDILNEEDEDGLKDYIIEKYSDLYEKYMREKQAKKFNI